MGEGATCEGWLYWYDRMSGWSWVEMSSTLVKGNMKVDGEAMGYKCG